MNTLMKEEVVIGDVILIRKGYNGNFINYLDTGKVVIVSNATRPGYGKITKIKKTEENYIIVEVEYVAHDYYSEIGLKEFKQVLLNRGYRIGFERPFMTDHGTNYQLLYYHLIKGIVVVAETYNGGQIFNSIHVYCPNVGGNVRVQGLYMSRPHLAIFNLSYTRDWMEPLKSYENLVKNPQWHEEESISLWTYADADDHNKTGEMQSSRWGQPRYSLWANTIDRVLLAPEEIQKILGKSRELKPVFASVKK